ncbi:SDR family NAD(P)-dependent oxidoreductase [Anaerocolumna sedimenticola]|uniref:SDR family NAD(P)-dependent oxidoreductase n=1 Tax=Anaerocolumna sedimenticola TaxID=2696063 RepID=A0A6P1TTE5_9FIRM|nr:SDR family oxidoreductase [Anaerocolumna sedimenticola]QHQ63479.1 SDR family NAD(P)-dependent oxidoreductase [Anaerocolumna sedimenticola]
MEEATKKSNPDQEVKKKIALVTGANSGMGKATAAALADQGFQVVMLCRSRERGETALSELQSEKDRDLKLMLCNLGSMQDIRRFTEEFKVYYDRLDVLVNNAGVISLERRETEDGLEEQFGVNHIGHFLLTLRLLDKMKPGSRIVVVSSGAHKIGKIHFNNYNLKHGFNVITAYSQSKLANILFARELAERLRGRGITVNCCHPGAVATSMGINRDTGFGKTIVKLLKPYFLTPEMGASTAVYLATSPDVEHATGKYFYRCWMTNTSKAAKSKKAARKLFILSEKITGEKLQNLLPR